jgi:ATP-dependent Lon protease
MEEVLEHALVRQPVPIEWEEPVVKSPAPATPAAEDDAPGMIAH